MTTRSRRSRSLPKIYASARPARRRAAEHERRKMNVFDYLKMNADRPNHWESEPLSGKDVREILNELERMRARVAELEALLQRVLKADARPYTAYNPFTELAHSIRASLAKGEEGK